jgi:hypothetical protein
MNVLAGVSSQVLRDPAATLAAVREWERQGAVLALNLRHVEVTGGYLSEHCVTMKEWLRHGACMPDDKIDDLLGLGRFLDTNTAFAEAAVAGVLSAGQIRVTRRLGRPKYAGLLRELQHDLVATLAGLDIDQTGIVVDEWKARADALLAGDVPPLETPCELKFARTMDNRLHGRLSLHDAAATEFETAILTASTWEGRDETRSVAERQGDALYDICAFFNANHTGDGTPRHLPNVTLSTDLGSQTAVNDNTGRTITTACRSMLLCDCALHVLIRNADGVPERFGRATYTVPRSLFRQVAARDRGCRFPGCNRPVRFTDAHHIEHWEHGGTTDYHNLLLLCRRHHTYVHSQRLTVKLLPTGLAAFTWHDGTHKETRPRGQPPNAPHS